VARTPLARLDNPPVVADRGAKLPVMLPAFSSGPFREWITLEAVLQGVQDEAAAAEADANITSDRAATGAFPVAADAPPLTEDTVEPIHSEDFRWVNWFGKEHTFSACQAAIVQELWKAWEKGILGVGWETLKEDAGVKSKRISYLFRGHEAFQTMIVKVGNGVYGLKAPDGYRRGRSRPGPTPSDA
jgi:hypothetical protein